MNPLYLSEMLGIDFPLAIDVKIVITPVPPFVYVMGFSFTAGMIGPAGLSARYPISSGDMSLEVLLVANLQNIAASALLINATNLRLGRILYAMGLYRLDGYCPPPKLSPPPPLSYARPPPPQPGSSPAPAALVQNQSHVGTGSCAAAVSPDITAAMHDFLDVLDTISIEILRYAGSCL